jgi:signal transduction histidine kinase
VICLEAKGLKNNLVSSEKASSQIIDEVDKLTNLVQDLDWLAETDSGVFMIHPEPYSIEKIIINEIERWRLKAESTGISLVLTPIPPGLPDLYIDVLKISQVVGNLIENGLKYIPEGRSIFVGCKKEDDFIVLSICDNGPGINPEDLPFLFDRFYRAEKSWDLSKRGRGLGLSIVKQIVELHHGSVRVESSPGLGSQFYISLPISFI